MNTTCIPASTGVSFGSYYSVPKGSGADIVSGKKVQEPHPKDSFKAPLGIFVRMGPATAMFCVTLGSGAMNGLTEDGLREALSRNQAQLVRSSVETNEYAQVNDVAERRTVGEQLREIRQAFGLTMTDMATLFGSSRPTMYAWMDGQEPRPETATRILALAKLADEFDAMGLQRPDTLVKRPLFENSQSLFDLVQQGKNIRVHFGMIRDLDEKEAASRSKAKGSGVPIRSFDEAVADSTPLTFE